MKISMTLNHRTICLATTVAWLLGCGGTKQEPPAEPVPTPAPQTPDAGMPQDAEPHAEVIAFILSQCPYAAEAMRSLLVLKREMGSALNLSVGYVGLVDGDGNIDPSVGGPETAHIPFPASQPHGADE